MTTQWEYEFDPYGDNPNNLIVDEPHTITPANGKNFSFFIPRKGPFHRRSVVLKDAVSGALLNVGTDYYFGWRYDDIIVSGSVQPVYGAIVFNDPTKTYNLKMTYQNLGGPTMIDDAEIAQLLANTLRDPRRALWTDVVDVPTELPPIPHRQSTADLVGFDLQIEVLYKIADAIAEGNVKAMQALMEHVADHHNPHRITLADLGIDDLGNLIPATKEEAEGGVDNTHYMTSLRVDQYSKANVIPVINAHVADKTNPHGTTAAQVGLGSVQNYPVASTVEAEAGVATNRYMTPAMTTTLMTKNFKPLVDNHIADKNNPHGTTKAQVGLGSVDNYPTATAQEAGEGTATNRFMTPYLTSIAIAAQVNVAIDFHTGDFDNPHKTTAAQVGLGNVSNYATASTQEATAGTAIDKFMTPYLTSQAITVLAPLALEFHTGDTNNPHGVTKTQVGLGNVSNYSLASLAEALNGTANDRYMSPYLTDQLIAKRLAEAGVGSAVTKETIGLGSVENYAPATATDMQTLAGTKYVTTSALASFFQGNGGASTFITKNTVGLGQLQNFPVAGDVEIEARSNEAYATPYTVDKMMAENLISSPILTQQADTAFTKKPYSLVAAKALMGVVATGDGIVTSYQESDIINSDQAYFSSEYAITGTQAQTFTLSNVVTTAAMTVPVVYLKSSADSGYHFGIQINGTTASLALVEPGSAEAIGTPTTIAGLTAGGSVTLECSLNATSGAYSIALKIGSNTYNFNGTKTDLLTAAGLPDDPATLTMQGAFGLSVDADLDNLTTNGIQLSATYIPASTTGLLVNVDTNTKYTYNGTTWVASNLAVYYRQGATYWNPMTDELFIAVTTRHVIPFGMNAIVA